MVLHLMQQLTGRYSIHPEFSIHSLQCFHFVPEHIQEKKNIQIPFKGNCLLLGKRRAFSLLDLDFFFLFAYQRKSASRCWLQRPCKASTCGIGIPRSSAQDPLWVLCPLQSSSLPTGFPSSCQMDHTAVLATSRCSTATGWEWCAMTTRTWAMPIFSASSWAAAVHCQPLWVEVCNSHQRQAIQGNSGPIRLDGVKRMGTEVAFSYCRANDCGKNNCHHGEDAGVVCSSNTWGIHRVGGCSWIFCGSSHMETSRQKSKLETSFGNWIIRKSVLISPCRSPEMRSHFCGRCLLRITLLHDRKDPCIGWISVEKRKRQH